MKMDHRVGWMAVAVLAVAIGVLIVASAGSAGNDAAGTEAKGETEMDGREIEVYSAETDGIVRTEKVVKTDEEWRRELDPEQYRILREAGTERAFTGKYWNSDEPGTYLCAACGNDLFAADSKFASGCGWPSFSEPVSGANIDTATDRSLGMVRTEVTCSRCGAHLGHVFEDGPKPTGLRFCINSGALEHVPPGEK